MKTCVVSCCLRAQRAPVCMQQVQNVYSRQAVVEGVPQEETPFMSGK